MIDVPLTTVTFVAGFPPKLTVVPGVKFAPVSVTAVPPTVGPLLGVTVVTLGGAGHPTIKAIATGASRLRRVTGFKMTRFLREISQDWERRPIFA